MSAKPELPPRRKRRYSGTAAWHVSLAAVDLTVAKLYALNNTQCFELLTEIRFGGRNSVQCPHCGSIGKHYRRVLERRFKCRACRKTFSVTSGTIFANRRIPLQDLLAATLTWVNSSAGQPALELKRHLGTTYNAAFTLQAKLREALVRGYNVGLLSGDIEIDGAHQSGRRADEKRGRPRGKPETVVDVTDPKALAELITHAGQVNARNRRKRAREGGSKDPEHAVIYPRDRRILFSVRKRSGIKGRGAVASRVAVGRVEEEEVANTIFDDFVAPSESTLNSDMAGAYVPYGDKFREHRRVEHGDMLVGPNGENNNLAEEYNARFDRAEKGIYLNIEPKYMLDYAVEMAFKADNRRRTNGDQFRIALKLALSVGHSRWWRGYTKGRHRKEELLHPEPQPALPSGPKKGRHPISSMNGRPPR